MLEEDCVEQSLKIIREYLVRAFPGFEVTEDISESEHLPQIYADECDNFRAT
jgi:hypothetical protein